MVFKAENLRYKNVIDSIQQKLAILHSAISCIPELVMPQTCNVCGVEDSQAICERCFDQHFVPMQVVCKKCGRLRTSGYSGDDCALCYKTDLRCVEARSLFTYSGTARQIFLKAKFNEKRYALAKSLAHLSVLLWSSTGASHLHYANPPDNYDYIVEVPIIRPMQFKDKFAGLMSLKMPKAAVNRRSFNFSRLLAQTLAKSVKCKWQYDVLVKVKDVPSQIGLNESERRLNVKGAFEVNSLYKHKMKGKNVMLVDDLMTTGATANECCKTLKRAGVKGVYMFTLFSTSPVFTSDRSMLDDDKLLDDLYIPDPII